ncbi:MAG: hypothetical protein GY938_16680 [Ketobacter sp.]|nr:hypothetical protein [Ketobacter sp.]
MDLQNIAIWIVSMSGGVVPATQWIKGVLGVKGWKANLLSAIGAVIGAIITLWADGQLLPADFAGWGDVSAIALAIYSSAQGFYFVVHKNK